MLHGMLRLEFQKMIAVVHSFLESLKKFSMRSGILIRELEVFSIIKLEPTSKKILLGMPL